MRDIRGRYESGPVRVKEHVAFGWKVHQHNMDVGTKLHTTATREVPRNEAPNLTLYVRGRATFTQETGRSFPDRIPGMYSGDRPNTPAGRCTHTAIEPLEFWCINRTANRGVLPTVTILRVAAGQSFTPPAGQRVLLCAGKLGSKVSGDAFVADGQPLVAGEDSYGFLFGGDRV